MGSLGKSVAASANGAADPGFRCRSIRATVRNEHADEKSPHVGRVIGHGIFEPLGLSISKAADALGVRRATLSDLINGKAALIAEMALRIHKAFGP